jgi:hypothetical protein
MDASACTPLQASRPDPLTFTTAEHILQTDQAKMNSDLVQEGKDARKPSKGRNGMPTCYNLTQNVNVEIASMDNFARGTVTDDATAMQDNINALRTERADFNRDINDFVNDGVARPVDEVVTIAAITREIEDAVASARKTISAIWADLRAARRSAGHLVTGKCKSDAPEGIPPEPPVR